VISLTQWPNLVTPEGTPWTVASWGEVYERLSQSSGYLGDNIHPGWSPAEFSPCRRGLENVRNVSALCLDYDAGEALGAVVGRLEPLAGGFLHTTRKHTDQAPRCRVVLPLARPVSPFEFGELWKRVAPAAGQVDPAPKDPSRFWFLPGSAGPFLVRHWLGKPLDPDTWLAKVDPTRMPVNVAPAPRRGSDPESRARRYIAKMPPSIAGQGGHGACWEVALYLARGFGLSEDTTLRILREDFNPRCEPPWSERELEHKAKGATKAERVPLGFLLNDEREWAPKSHRLPPPEPEVDEHEGEDGYWVITDPDEPEESAASELAREPGDDSDEPPKPPPTATERYQLVELRALCFEVLAEAKAGGAKRGHTTGHYQIDAMLCGLRPTHVALLAAPTSWGKSSFGVMVADENLALGVPVLVVSVEDSKIMYGKRIVARRSGVNALRLRDNDCSADEIRRIEATAFNAQAEPFLLSGVGKTVEYIAQGIRDLVAERKIGIVICDYVQRFRTAKHSGDRRNQVTYVAETLSDAIKTSGAAGVLLSQLKRTDGRAPTMDDVKESGDLENMAEHVLIGHRTQEARPKWGNEDEPPWKRFLFIPKNKDGPTSTGEIVCPFNEVTASFDRVKDPEAERLHRIGESAQGDEAFSDFDRRFGS
jgi:hypothetical protein